MKTLTNAAALTAALIAGDAAMAGTPEENIQVVQDFFVAYGANDLDGIAAVMDENVRWHIPGRHPLSGTKQGRAEVMDFFAQLGTAGFKADPIYFGADETHVVDIHRGWSNAESKPNVDTTWALVYRIEDGRIVEATNLSADQDAANAFFRAQYGPKEASAAASISETQGITNAVYSFFAAVDTQDWDGTQALMANPFHLDYSSFGAGPGADLPPADILEEWKAFLPGFDATHHHLGPLEIEVAGDSATVRTSVIATHQIAGAEDGDTWTVYGDYVLKLVRDNGWKLSSNTFRFKFLTGNAGLPALAQARLK